MVRRVISWMESPMRSLALFTPFNAVDMYLHLSNGHLRVDDVLKLFYSSCFSLQAFFLKVDSNRLPCLIRRVSPPASKCRIQGIMHNSLVIFLDPREFGSAAATRPFSLSPWFVSPPRDGAEGASPPPRSPARRGHQPVRRWRVGDDRAWVSGSRISRLPSRSASRATQRFGSSLLLGDLRLLVVKSPFQLRRESWTEALEISGVLDRDPSGHILPLSLPLSEAL
ncbi:hypothetical protein FNV43_RR16937 [Rhamnella rubrinervis]|uniref:Uncharacterized protein n=1 Tax=Rhamnella rubrinervis TaxID=2594499 RepID=A0A8K0ME29_9ROSA|nr:hypothetical protein FNV43_RR16937 [Rhamnella rubrinervis]